MTKPITGKHTPKHTPQHNRGHNQNPLVECGRCRNKHHLNQRLVIDDTTLCPRCGARPWFRAEEQPDLF